MAWNEPGGNNKPPEDKNPWTGKPKQQSGPPDLEAALRKLREKLNQFLKNKPIAGFKPGNNGTAAGDKTPIPFGRVGIIVTGLLVVLWALSGIYLVGPAEQAVELRFGQYLETVGPGPHWLPRFINDVYLVNEQKIATYSYDAEMLTEDENIVSVALAVQYRIADARNYLFNTVNPDESLRQATASALRQVIGHTDLTEVLTSGREQIRQQVQDQITKILSRYNTGLLVTDVAMQPAKAPDEVKDAFDDAIKAQEDEQRYENQAQSYAMQVEPIAKGQAQRLLADAQAYQQQVVLHAKADVAPFLAILPQYQKSPAVTRERMYLETVESVLSDTNKVLVDIQGSNMFYLPLDKLMPVASSINKESTPTIATTSVLNTTDTATTTVSPPLRSDSPYRSSTQSKGGY
jgi:membrane protease subunit HflK